MELRIKIDNEKLKEFGLDGIFKDAQKQMERMGSDIFSEDFNKVVHPKNLLINQKRKINYSVDEIMQMQTNALLELRKEVVDIVENMSISDLVNFIKRQAVNNRYNL